MTIDDVRDLLRWAAATSVVPVLMDRVVTHGGVEYRMAYPDPNPLRIGWLRVIDRDTGTFVSDPILVLTLNKLATDAAAKRVAEREMR